MTSIAIVGAGSLVFTRTLVNDLLHQEATADAEIHLVDIDERRLRNAHEVVEGLMVAANRRVAVKATTNCAEGVRGCRYVINTIQVGGRKATELDFDLPEKFGVRQTIADTHGIGGISRALRTVPPVLEIARTVAEHSLDRGSSTTPTRWLWSSWHSRANRRHAISASATARSTPPSTSPTTSVWRTRSALPGVLLGSTT